MAERSQPPEAGPVRSAAAAALADLEALPVSDPLLRAVTLGALLLKRLDLPAPSGDPAAPEFAGQENDADVEKGDLLGEIAKKMHLPREVVELVYDAEEGDLAIVVSARRLQDDRANATRQLAQIVAGGRQAAGLEEWTPLATVRAVVADYGRMDSGNFATTVARLDDVFLFRGKGASREVKVTRPGMEEIATLVGTLAGA